MSAPAAIGGQDDRWRSIPLWAVAAALLIAALGCYANAFGNPFLLDDHDGVIQNTHIRQLWPLTDTLRGPVQSAVAGRPIVSLSLALNYWWGELSPAGYHAVNLAVLWLTSVLLFALVRCTLRLPAITVVVRRDATAIALAAAALWLVHPLQTEVVNYVVQRSESLMGLLYVGTMYASLRAMTDVSGARWTAVAVVVCALGMATKESMATAPLMVLVFDVVFVSGSMRKALTSRPSLYGGLALSWVVLVALNAGGPRSRSAGLASGVSPLTYLLHQGEMIATYLKLAIWPHPLIADYGVTTPITLAQAAPWVAFVSLLVASAVWLFWKRPQAGFPALWFFVTLAPASSVIPIATEVGAERRMYLPLAGLIVLVVLAAAAIVRRFENQATRVVSGRSASAVTAVICLVLAATTHGRNADYSDEAQLWSGAIDARPTGRAHYNRGIVLKERGQADAAMAEYQKAADLGHWEAHYAIGFEQDTAGKLDDAIASYRRFLDQAGEDYRVPRTWILLGRAQARQGRLKEAEAAYRRVLAMTPDNLDAQAGLGDALLESGRYAEAAEAYRLYVGRNATNAGAFGNLGKALIALDRQAEAIEAFARAAALAPGDAGARLNYGMALASGGRVDEAIAQYGAALEQTPTDVRLLGALGVALAMKGSGQEAIETFTRAFRLDPSNPQLRDDFRTVFGVEPRGPSGR